MTQSGRHITGYELPDFYLWGHLKDRVYSNKLQTIHDLKAAITAAIRAILTSRTLPVAPSMPAAPGN